MAYGTVKWFNTVRGFGFITPEDGSSELIAHYSAITGEHRQDLREGQRVEFDPVQTPKGLQAINIRDRQ